ncbi:putative transporter SVOPL [Convolutriloba macropyga]|uniref:putative transporter SVOPL n=1 Tax=Convolutriloba macropyga TaxID=536237 RepID=UPI003F528620
MSQTVYGAVQTEEKFESGEKGDDAMSKRSKEFTPSELISMMGFGWTQIGIQMVFISTFFSQFLLLHMLPFLSTRLYVDLNLTPSQESAFSISSYFGFALSYVLWGWFSDKFGRKTYALASSVWIAIFSLFSAVAPSYTWLLICRVGYSLAGGATNLMGQAMYELIPAEHHWGAFVVGDEWASAMARAILILVAYFIFSDHWHGKFFSRGKEAFPGPGAKPW